MKRIYLDHSATTPVDVRAADAVYDFMVNRFGNPSSGHVFGREAKTGFDQARVAVANLINSMPEEIYFTSGGTEADNIALLGYAQRHRNEGDHVIVSQVEHPAVRMAADELELRGFQVSRVPADKYGMIHSEAVAELLTPRTILVSVMHVNNEVGTINDLGRIGSLLRDRGIAFHTDAVQSFGKVPIDVQELPIDLMSLSSHKIYGPKGVGALYIRQGREVQGRSFGGKQESSVRSGTENLPGIIGFGKAAEICAEEIQREAKTIGDLRDEIEHLLTSRLDNVRVNGHPEHRLPGNLSLMIEGVEGEAMLMALDVAGIGISTGSACSTGSTKPSAVLLAIGLSEEEAHSTIRLSLGRSNSRQDLLYAGELIIETANKLRSMSGY